MKTWSHSSFVLKRFLKGNTPFFLTLLLTIGWKMSLFANLSPHSLFTDHAVLQQGQPISVWGTSNPGESISVSFAGQDVTTKADANGNWKTQFPEMAANAEGQNMLIRGEEEEVIIRDLLIGEVWLCSGQSNMERQLGPREGQQPLVGWESEVASANYPQLRQFYVPQLKDFDVHTDIPNGAWTVCSPETAQNITAVGYYFGRDLLKSQQVPIGLIHSSWGGTPAEAWTSVQALKELGGFETDLEQMQLLQHDPEKAKDALRDKQERWFADTDPGSQGDHSWEVSELNVQGWGTMDLPQMWESSDYPTFNGVFWFRKTFDMPSDWNGESVELHLGAVDDSDTTWVNGQFVGSSSGWDTPRVYTIPSEFLKAHGCNVIAVRVLDTGGGGGLWGNSENALQIRYESKQGGSGEVSLTGEWNCKPSLDFANLDTNWPPMDLSSSSGAPGVLYNGMIHPLLDFPIRGVIWYQGEANAGRADQYQTLFPAMIKDWRERWGLGDFPFLFVQIAPHQEMTPEIREAQLHTWQHTENTAMVVTIDCGDAIDIHPTHKEPVGARLALAARALAYGESVTYAGPVLDSVLFDESSGILKFSEVAGGLTVPGGELVGFTVAGEDGVFYPAQATITGMDTIQVFSSEVDQPVAVRYGWDAVPVGNLFNRSGLPASPFRTDVEAVSKLP